MNFTSPSHCGPYKTRLLFSWDVFFSTKKKNTLEASPHGQVKDSQEPSNLMKLALLQQFKARQGRKGEEFDQIRGGFWAYLRLALFP